MAAAYLPPLSRLALAASCGLAWGGRLSALAFTPLLFVAWWRCNSRTEAAVVVMTYHAVAARSLVVAGSRFLDTSIGVSAGIIVLGSFVAAIPWMLFWSGPESHVSIAGAFMRVFGVFVLTTLPPITAFAVPSVWASAGVWFPRAGILGIAALIAIGAAMRAELHSARAPAWLFSLGLQALICGIMSIRAEQSIRAQPPGDTSAVQTNFEASSSDTFDFLRQWDVAHGAMDIAALHDVSLTVLPESSGGLWQPTMQREWSQFAAEMQRRGRRLLVGVVIPRSDEKLHAGVVLLGDDGSRYLQRVPMPFAMWRPWSNTKHSFDPVWFGSGTMHVGGRNLGMFVCWEIGVLWAVLGSITQGADALVVVANTAWARGTSAAQAEKQMTEAWGALFALPTIVSMNE